MVGTDSSRWYQENSVSGIYSREFSFVAEFGGISRKIVSSARLYFTSPFGYEDKSSTEDYRTHSCK